MHFRQSTCTKFQFWITHFKGICQCWQ